jgi:hypothetical protein
MASNNGHFDIAKEYVLAYPVIADTNQTQLARLLFEERSDTFTSVENARASIRIVMGSAGNRNRKAIARKDLFRPMKYDYRPNKKVMEKAGAKILILDIETAPIRGWVWSLWKQNVGINQIDKDWFMFTWSAKWLFDKKVMSDRLTKEEALKQSDKRIVKGIWKLLDEADIVIAHNGVRFDIPALNTRFLMHGMKPPSPYVQVDTLRVFQKQFRFSSNKLAYINKALGLKEKIETGGFELWSQCYAGHNPSLIAMEKYNIGDVVALEDLYLLIRAWIKPHPPVSIYILDGETRCPTCGSKDLQNQKGGDYVTQVNVFETVRCKSCGAVARKRKSSVKVHQKETLLISAAR